MANNSAFRTIKINNTFTENDIAFALDVMKKCGVQCLNEGKVIVFNFDAVDVSRLEKNTNNIVIAIFLTELHKIHSFSSANGKLVYASFNKDKKVQGKAQKSKKRLAYEAFKKDFPYENNELPAGVANSIVCADSKEFLSTLPDNCIDIILTSPPYNFGINYSSGGLGADDSAVWQDYFEKLFGVFDECVRVLKSGGRIIVNVQPMFSDYIPTHHFVSKHFVDSGLIWKGEILWEKNNYNCKYCTWGSWKSSASPYLKYSWEFIEVFCKNTLKKEGDKSNIDITDEEFKKWVYGKWSIPPERKMKQYGHDAMFPEELVRRLLKLFSYKGDIVLDPFNGAGTTTKVAKELGRKFVGVDIDEKYCDTARKRLDNASDLFNTSDEKSGAKDNGNDNR